MVNAIHYQVHYMSLYLSHSLYLDTRRMTGGGSRLKLRMDCNCTTSNNYAKVIWGGTDGNRIAVLFRRGIPVTPYSLSGHRCRE